MEGSATTGQPIPANQPNPAETPAATTGQPMPIPAGQPNPTSLPAPADVQVRLIRPGDAEATRRIYNVEVTGSTATFDLRPRTRDAHQRWVAAHLGGHPAVVATVGGTVAGFASLSPFRDRPAYVTSVEDSVYVDRAWRGRGLGRRLLDEVLRRAGDHGFHTVIARIEAGNTPSIALHLACGFTEVGTEREVGRKFGRWLDVTILQRML